jgi:Fe-S oxidoreductase
MMYYNPGCALMLYKPKLGEKVLKYLEAHAGPVALHSLCCHHDPQVPRMSVIINTCPGCDRRFSSLYAGVTTISLWEVLADDPNFPFPSYKGLKLSVHDACPIRNKPKVHRAVRSLLRNMDIEVVETEQYGENSICCGDSLYGPDKDIKTIHGAMHKRAQSMPCEEVCVYCVSCVKATAIGGRKPRYLVDLLFNEATDPQNTDLCKWHEDIKTYQAKH